MEFQPKTETSFFLTFALMKNFPKNLQKKLQTRKENNSFRNLGESSRLVDFSSNDYLGFTNSKIIFNRAAEVLKEKNIQQNGASGSRLLTGNSIFYEETETMIANFHQAESALIFNSGYGANLGFFASVPQRGDVVFYDEFIHASIRDGIRLGNAKAYKFGHNNLINLQKLLQSQNFSGNEEVYVVTESVFSMDGDSPDLKAFAEFCSKNNFHLVVDEAHAVGIFGKNGEGLVQGVNLQNQVFARIVTFGKALGCDGAAVLGNEELKDYLINFCRSFIYTTALPHHSLAAVRMAYSEMRNSAEKEKLNKNIAFFKSEIKKQKLAKKFVPSNSPIQTCIFSGNEKVKIVSKKLQNSGFDVKPILSPTVPKGKERLRFCLHSYNSAEEISGVLKTLTTFVPN